MYGAELSIEGQFELIAYVIENNSAVWLLRRYGIEA